MSAGGRSKGVSDSYWAVAARRLAGANVGSLSPMTEMGQTRKWPRLHGTSVLPSRADIVRPSWHVRLVPKAEVAALLDHLVATGEYLAAMVIRAARLAAILLRIARRLRHADKGPARL